MNRIVVVLLTMMLLGIAASGQAAPRASKKAAAASRRYINLPKPVQAPFSDAVTVGDTMYIAGRIGVDPKTGHPPADINDEIRILLDGFKAVLAEGGMTMDNLVFVQVFCPDLSLYTTFNDAYKNYFGKDYPARAFIGSGPLLRGGHFEMNGIAVKK